jgi:2-methylaconitate cis-trans-isomerase PrpF
MISPPADYRNVIHDHVVKADEADFVARLMFMQQMHKTYAGTSTVATGVASKIPGSIVHEAASPGIEGRLLTLIGHPAGVIETEVKVALDGNTFKVERATVGRTARRIMEGYVFPPDHSA